VSASSEIRPAAASINLRSQGFPATSQSGSKLAAQSFASVVRDLNGAAAGFHKRGRIPIMTAIWSMLKLF